MPGWKRVAPWVVCAGLVACAAPRIELSDPGEISGKLMVFWDREDHFIYYPFYGDPLTYRLPRSVAEKVGVDTIRPGAIYTDGGSIPRAVRGVVGFSPWGYGPAYIVHDWLFVAHHCIRHGLEDRHDPRDRDEVETVRKVDFPLSADILAGVIQALIEATFRLNGAGRLVGGVEASGENASNAVVKAASDRAKEAVHAAQPFENLPEQLYGERITVRFNAQNACATG